MCRFVKLLLWTSTRTISSHPTIFLKTIECGQAEAVVQVVEESVEQFVNKAPGIKHPGQHPVVATSQLMED